MYTVYSKPNCPDCEAVKNTLKSHGFPFEVIDITQDQEGFDKLMSQGLRKLPQVFKQDKYIGDFMKTKIYIENLHLADLAF